MKKFANKTPVNPVLAGRHQSQSFTNEVAQKTDNDDVPFQFEDNRPEAVTQRKLQEIVNLSPRVNQMVQLQAMADTHVARQQQPIQKKANKTGLPDSLKTGIENLSGHAMDDVNVHYNSAKPAQLNAHAYARGTDIHLAPGQEKHLPHEAWHVVQQKQGRVQPTRQMKDKVDINDNSNLENEATVMGSKALQVHGLTATPFKNEAIAKTKQLSPKVVQRFPFTLRHKMQPLVLVAKLVGSRIVIYQHGAEMGYLNIDVDGTVYGIKDIIIHNESSHGQGLGTVLVSLFARLAALSGATSLRPLLANGSELYARCGFVVTPDNVNPNNPPTITGVPAIVRNTAEALVNANYKISDGLPPPHALAPRRGSINPSGRKEGNVYITEKDL